MRYTGANSAYTVVRGADTYTGGTTITRGIVEIEDDAAFGTGAVTMTGAIPAIETPRTLANTFTLSGTIGRGYGTNITGAIALAANTTITPSLNAGESTWSGNIALGGQPAKGLDPVPGSGLQRRPLQPGCRSIQSTSS